MVKDSSKEAFVEHHIKKYKGKMPIRAAVEIMDWGLLSHLYGMCPNSVRKAIAKRCGLSSPQLESWLKSLNVARNYSAHHARMYNRVYTIKPKFPQDEAWDGLRLKSNKIFAIIAITVYFSRMLGVSSREHFPVLLKRFPRSTRAMEHTMGLPTQWEKYLEIAPGP